MFDSLLGALWAYSDVRRADRSGPGGNGQQPWWLANHIYTWHGVADRRATDGSANGGWEEGASGLLGVWGGASDRRRGRDLVEGWANALSASSSKYCP